MVHSSVLVIRVYLPTELPWQFMSEDAAAAEHLFIHQKPAHLVVSPLLPSFHTTVYCCGVLANAPAATLLPPRLFALPCTYTASPSLVNSSTYSILMLDFWPLNCPLHTFLISQSEIALYLPSRPQNWAEALLSQQRYEEVRSRRRAGQIGFSHHRSSQELHTYLFT
jgi:hypothetical protein